MNKKPKTPNKSKKPSFLIIGLYVVVATVSMIAVITFVYGKYQNHMQVQQLHETDKDLQKFADQLEKSFPGQVHTEKYCRHDGVKLGKGALRCITSISIKTLYASEDALVTSINKLNALTQKQNWFNISKPFTDSSNNERVVSLHSVKLTNKNTEMICNASNNTVHFDSVAVERRGEFSFSAHCTAGPLQNSIYELRD